MFITAIDVANLGTYIDFVILYQTDILLHFHDLMTLKNVCLVFVVDTMEKCTYLIKNK